jgi:hypothetical protein
VLRRPSPSSFPPSANPPITLPWPSHPHPPLPSLALPPPAPPNLALLLGRCEWVKERGDGKIKRVGKASNTITGIEHVGVVAKCSVLSVVGGSVVSSP